MLRQKQFEIAMTGNVSMLIWLGKQRLGQIDKQEIKTKETPSFSNNRESKLYALEQHARRVFKVYFLEPKGIEFDQDNPDHIKELKEHFRQVIEARNSLYPDDVEQLKGWEEYFDQGKHWVKV